MKSLISIIVFVNLLYSSSLYSVDEYNAWNIETSNYSAYDMSYKFYQLVNMEDIQKEVFYILGSNKKLLRMTFKGKSNLKSIFDKYSFVKINCKNNSEDSSICSYLLNKNNLNIEDISLWGYDPGLSYVDPFYITLNLKKIDNSFKIVDIY